MESIDTHSPSENRILDEKMIRMKSALRHYEQAALTN